MTQIKSSEVFIEGEDKRQALNEVNGNINIHAKRQKRTKQSNYGCTSEACEGLAACKTAAC